MRALYLAVVIMMLLATAMNVEGYIYKPSCSAAKGRCAKYCEKTEYGYYGYDCTLCCFKYKKDD